MRVTPCPPIYNLRNNRKKVPYYSYKCEKCELEFEENLPIDQRMDPTLENPSQHCSQGSNADADQLSCAVKLQVSAPSIGYRVTINGKRKPDNAFNDKLKEIKRAHYGSTVNVIE